LINQIIFLTGFEGFEAIKPKNALASEAPLRTPPGELTALSQTPLLK